MCAAFEAASWGYWTRQSAAILSAHYLRKVQDAGALVIGLVPDQRGIADPVGLVERIDGLLLAGGVDVDPENYGHSASAHLEATVPMRDEFELALTRAAFERDLPVLGICRGLHIMNVAHGGTLHQHLDADRFTNHRPTPGRLDESTYHAVDVLPATLAAQALGAGVQQVNSHHHQGIDRVGTGAVVTARAAGDNLPEALEWEAQRFALGVQWHPEAMPGDNTVDAFVRAVRTSQRVGAA
ncbi:gamma-glutamyl-gamma-aminobutyrate hydrolase family protein [Kribbella sp. CA-253562]|uniref:gamma-glutamyl-gamma-aminobutyrate hydrolase family protein n=1 Tax=Kribbella sp. CA-253562 TaxID=3239942 RepID=UPI003D944223